jgi:deoxycytidylate deaminase
MTTKRRYSITATTYDKRGRVIATGENSYVRTHPVQAYYASKANQQHRISLHAEISAIIRSRNREIHKIKIERYDAAGNPKLGKPCPVCELAIREAGIKFVEYTVGE